MKRRGGAARRRLLLRGGGPFDPAPAPAPDPDRLAVSLALCTHPSPRVRRRLRGVRGEGGRRAGPSARGGRRSDPAAPRSGAYFLGDGERKEPKRQKPDSGRERGRARCLRLGAPRGAPRGLRRGGAPARRAAAVRALAPSPRAPGRFGVFPPRAKANANAAALSLALLAEAWVHRRSLFPRLKAAAERHGESRVPASVVAAASAALTAARPRPGGDGAGEGSARLHGALRAGAGDGACARGGRRDVRRGRARVLPGVQGGGEARRARVPGRPAGGRQVAGLLGRGARDAAHSPELARLAVEAAWEATKRGRRVVGDDDDAEDAEDDAASFAEAKRWEATRGGVRVAGRVRPRAVVGPADAPTSAPDPASPSDEDPSSPPPVEASALAAAYLSEPVSFGVAERAARDGDARRSSGGGGALRPRSKSPVRRARAANDARRRFVFARRGGGRGARVGPAPPPRRARRAQAARANRRRRLASARAGRSASPLPPEKLGRGRGFFGGKTGDRGGTRKKNVSRKPSRVGAGGSSPRPRGAVPPRVRDGGLGAPPGAARVVVADGPPREIVRSVRRAVARRRDGREGARDERRRRGGRERRRALGRGRPARGAGERVRVGGGGFGPSRRDAGGEDFLVRTFLARTWARTSSVVARSPGLGRARARPSRSPPGAGSRQNRRGGRRDGRVRSRRRRRRARGGGDGRALVARGRPRTPDGSIGPAMDSRGACAALACAAAACPRAIARGARPRWRRYAPRGGPRGALRRGGGGRRRGGARALRASGARDSNARARRARILARASARARESDAGGVGASAREEGPGGFFFGAGKWGADDASPFLAGLDAGLAHAADAGASSDFSSGRERAAAREGVDARDAILATFVETLETWVRSAGAGDGAGDDERDERDDSDASSSFVVSSAAGAAAALPAAAVPLAADAQRTRRVSARSPRSSPARGWGSRHHLRFEVGRVRRRRVLRVRGGSAPRRALRRRRRSAPRRGGGGGRPAARVEDRPGGAASRKRGDAGGGRRGPRGDARGRGASPARRPGDPRS